VSPLHGRATNPEQLFAGGYAACFENAILHVSRDAGHRFADDDIDVAAHDGPRAALHHGRRRAVSTSLDGDTASNQDKLAFGAVALVCHGCVSAQPRHSTIRYVCLRDNASTLIDENREAGRRSDDA
jgi:organic hydroperoxide reductase OsmC/OhrA